MTQFRNVLVTSWDAEPVFDPDVMQYMNYQQEKAPDTGRLHWQIFVQFKDRKRIKWMKAHFGNSAHFEKVVVDNGASEYCLKDETSVEGTRREFGTKRPNSGGAKRDQQAITFDQIVSCEKWCDVLSLPNVGYQLNWAREVWANRKCSIPVVSVLRPWQQEEYDALQLQNDREIRFVVDFKGGEGKTKLAQYLVENLNAFYCTGGKTCDIMHAYSDQEYVVFDLARCTGVEFWPFQVMEFFKNGMGFSPKYTSCTKQFKPCKIIVFSNQDINYSKLSADRYSVRFLNTISF